MKQFQNLTDQMALLIKNQQPGTPPQIESDNHSSRFSCTQCQQHAHTRQFCRNWPNRDQRMNNNIHNKTKGVQIKIKTKKIIGVLLLEDKLTKIPKKKEFHHLCGRYHVVRQCWSKNQTQGCSKCGGPHLCN